MICPLCRYNEANKPNTHYLTDSIIRTALNLEGSNVRESGFYFTVETGNPFFDFNFQRATPIIAVENALGRDANENEIAEAKRRLYSVDKVFCSDCETRFTEIEAAFIANVLPSFRNSNLSGRSFVTIDNIRLARTFFYLQIWRSAICESIFALSEEIKESLRIDILRYRDGGEPSLFPMLITYLETLGGAFQFTNNLVGYTDDIAPRLILFNDFVIQFFSRIDQVRFFDFHGLNSPQDYMQMLNFGEDAFRVKIIHDQERLQFRSNVLRKEVVKGKMRYFEDRFVTAFNWIFGLYPPAVLVSRFLQYFVAGGEDDLLRYGRNGVGLAIMTFLIAEFPHRFPGGR